MPKKKIDEKTDLFNNKPNQLILGDNLEVLKTLQDESVDLIYIDPPFFSNRNYEVIWGDAGEVRSFKDRWSGGVDHYINWLYDRVLEMHRILKKTGSMYLHCDWHADAYIRVYIMDKIFGAKNLKNHIIWRRNLGHHLSTGNYDTINDSIYFYTKSKKYTFNSQYQQLSKGELDKKFLNIEPETNRRYQHRGLEQTANSGSKNEIRIVNGKEYKTDLGWRWSQETFDNRLKKNSYALFETSGGKLRFKIYADEYEGRKVTNIWMEDIMPLGSQSREVIGYPTQKPEALLERIIKASSNEGDVVLDAFMGGGTTIAVADKLKRRWIGIDQSVQAVSVTEARIDNQQWERGKLFDCVPFMKKLHKYDYKTLFNMNAFIFEGWIVEQFGGVPNAKKVGDKGIDGRAENGTPIQVKQSESIGRNVVDNFVSASKRFNKPLFEKQKKAGKLVGTIIAFSFGKGAVQEVARLKNEDGIIIKLVLVKDIVPMGTGPRVELSFKDLGLNKKEEREIEFIAKADDTDGGSIECYMWDFDYNVEEKMFKGQVLNDKVGTQKWKFKAGEHNICVKAIDDDGLEGEEVVKLKINGGVKKV